MNDLLIQFSTEAGERSYGRTVADLIRAEQHNLAEEKLIADLASLPVPLAELCLDTRDDPIELQPWDMLQQLIFRPCGRRDSLGSAVGMKPFHPWGASTNCRGVGRAIHRGGSVRRRRSLSVLCAEPRGDFGGEC